MAIETRVDNNAVGWIAYQIFKKLPSTAPSTRWRATAQNPRGQVNETPKRLRSAIYTSHSAHGVQRSQAIEQDNRTKCQQTRARERVRGDEPSTLHQTVQLQPLEQRIRGPVAHVTHTRRNSLWHASQVTAKSTLEAAIGFMGPTEPSTYLSDILRK